MYDDIIHLAMDQQLLTELKDTDSNAYKRLPIYKSLQNTNHDDLKDIEEKLRKSEELTFDHIFHQPVGYHLFKSFLQTINIIDKAIFISDVEVYKKLREQRARSAVAKRIFERYLSSDIGTKRRGQSVFALNDLADEENEEETKDNGNSDQNPQSNTKTKKENVHSQTRSDYSLIKPNSPNTLNLDHQVIDELKLKMQQQMENPDPDLFDKIYKKIYDDLCFSNFDKFLSSRHYLMFLRCKSIESERSNVKDFHQMRMLGRGAFGSVNACKKKDTGRLYAMKQINKRRVQATDSAKTIMAERDFLALVDSKYVTTLKYAMQDENTLYLVLDLMVGGDLKYHLNNEKIFSEERSKFYAAEVLLGIEHLHSKNIIYRDLKLENVLMDDKGHCKISDLGLAVDNIEGGVKGYAGTPGYTAPEVVLSHHYYGTIVDFFSLGVMIYRFLCGRKPYQPKRRRRNRDHDDPKRRTSELDRNVVEMEPEFPSSYFSPSSKSLIKGLLVKNPKRRLGTKNIQDIKDHPWFDDIDFGLLEAGYCKPPFEPPLDELNAEQQTNLGRPPQDEKYMRTKIKPEFEDQLKGFSYHNTLVVQEEIVSVLEKIAINNRRSSQNGNITSDIDLDEPQNNGKSCIKNCQIL